ncbi:hypothetical protein M0805_007718 [Coniferiporia weirii]|nr:hypothetical protein M0805_007718 [Coniferiporia weirii]
MSSRPPPKKPSGSRPIRRLFSKNSLSSLASKANESITGRSAHDVTAAGVRADEPRGRVLTAPLAPLEETLAEVHEEKAWVQKDFVLSPVPTRDYDAFDESPSSSSSTQTPHSVGLPKSSTSSYFSTRQTSRQSKTSSVDLASSRSSTSSPPLPLSPSKARWDQLRHHVLPSPARADSPNPSFTSFSQLGPPTAATVPAASAAPRPSRFAARFGFRQVVVEAREAAATDDLSRKFSEDVQRACWYARFGDTRPSRPEREASQHTLGSTLHLPFMSSASLPLSGNASMNNLSVPSSFKQGLRTTASTTNLTPQPTSRMNALASLQSVIIRYASTPALKRMSYKFLPHEKDVLSVLLIAFLSESTGHIAEDERRLSLEIFETVIQSWKASQIEGDIERCLWCCKACSMPSNPLRSRVLLSLRSLLNSQEPLLTSPVAYRTILPILALLVPNIDDSHSQLSGTYDSSASDLAYVQEIITDIISGKCGQLDIDELEQKYQGLALKTDTEDDLRQGICVDAIARCLDYGTLEQKRLMLRIVERHWALPDQSAHSTPLRTKIQSGKITTFLQSVLNMLQGPLKAATSSTLTLSDINLIAQMLTTRVLPELNNLDSPDDSLSSVRGLAVKVALVLISVEADLDKEYADDTFSEPKITRTKELVLGWLSGAPSKVWQGCIQKELKEFATSAEWDVILHVGSSLVSSLPENSRKTTVGLIIPQCQERMISDPPPYPCERLTRLLGSFATVCPQIFYKPLFLCAASTKEEIVAHQLAILVMLERYMPSFWITDAEMVSVALMSNPAGRGGIGRDKEKEEQLPAWAKPRLGQTIVLLELMGKLRTLRTDHAAKQDAGLTSSLSIAKVVKFASTLEARLVILIDAKEQTMLLPLSQRILFSSLFLEIRLLSRTLKSTAWLPRIIAWTVQHDAGMNANTSALPLITEDLMEEVEETWDKLELVYTLCKTSMRPASQRRGTVILSPRPDNATLESSQESREALIDHRLKILESLPNNPLCILLEVLVAMCGALKHEDFARLGPLLWDECLNLKETKAVVHACFMCMQCAEKAHIKFQEFLNARLQSPDAKVRRETVYRLSILSGWRFQLLSLTYITDRAFRRPFKLARPPLSFVATDVGDSKYVADDDYEERAGGKSHSLPLDLRRRLNEIGWDEEDKPQGDHKLEWLRTPMYLLASSQLDQISTSATTVDDGQLSDRSPTPVASPGSTPTKSPSGSEGGLLRRNSSSAEHHGIKRRPVFVQPLVSIFLPLAKLAMDTDFLVASLARDLLMDYMRDDPAVLCRPVIDILSGGVEAIDEAVSTLRIFLHLNRVLPPRLTFHVFNHLAGYLKMLAKDSNAPDSLRHLALTVPILAKFAPQVSDMSVRAIRRAKIEVFLFPSGMLYFPESTPSGPMFPKGPDRVANPFDDCPSTLVYMTMIRMSQNLLFVDILKRSPQDVLIVRKSWSPLILPEVPDFIDSDNVLPRRSAKRNVPGRSQTSFRLSLSFSRSHLLFIAQVFRCLTRHLNDRAELAGFMDGVNRILLRHGDDIGIVSHALIVYMIASTRFRRLMSSGTGFTIFLPVLFKIYCEAEGDAGVREAIEYAVHRFYAVHEDIFVYQALQVFSNIVVQSAADGDWVANSAFRLLSTLKSNPSGHDAAGIRDANKAQEEETALAITADERPQMFLASLRKDGKAFAEKLQNSLSAEFFESKRFHPDNIIRMLLTVIAHDPTVKRAEYFLRLFRFLAPHLYDASTSARNVLRDGIDALGAIVTSKATAKAKATESAQKLSEGSGQIPLADGNFSSSLFENAASPCDVQSMRSDYLLLLVQYVKGGGALRATSLRKSLDLAKLILKESSMSNAAVESVQLFIDRLAETFILRGDPNYAVSILRELAPIISAHGSMLDLTGMLQSLVTLTSQPNFANHPKFSNVVVTQICASALEICEMAAQENILSTLKFRHALITLLTQSVCLLKSDIITELEKRDPSPAFLSGIVLPFILRLRTTAELATDTQWTDSWRQDAHARTWVRLLSYTMAALQSQTSAGLKSSRGSIKRSASFTSDTVVDADADTTRPTSKKAKRRPSGQSSILTSVRLAMAFVTLKAVVLRGEDDISSIFPGAWVRVGALLRTILRDGNAMFALRGNSSSASASALPSPVASTSFTELIDKTNERSKHRRSSSSDANHSASFLSTAGRPSRPSSPLNPPPRRNSAQPFPCPRLVDYLTWSLLEFISLRRSPLMIQLRTFMHERAVQLYEALQMREAVSGNASFTGSARTRSSIRPPSTVYAKPRFSMKTNSPTRTPEGSPFLGPSDPNVSFAGNLTSIYGVSGLTGSDNFTSTPMVTTGRRPIIHLGAGVPPSNSFLSPSFMPSSTSANQNLSYSQSMDDIGQNDIVLDTGQALTVTTLRSPALVRRTYERIRIVQKCLCYHTFLPIPKSLSVHAEVGGDGYARTYSGFGEPGNVSASTSPRTSVLFDMKADPEPEPRVWSKRRAAELLLIEAQDLLRAWQVESAITASSSDASQWEASMSAAASAEGDFDVTFVSAVEALPGF